MMHILKVHIETATEARRSQSQRALHHCLSEGRRHTGVSGFARKI